MEEGKWNLEILKMLVQEEQHLRTIFHSRVEHHAKLVLTILGAVGVGVFKSDHFLHLMFLGSASLVAAWLALTAPAAVKRINMRFIETIKNREHIEKLLGLRTSVAGGGICLKAGEGDFSSKYLQNIFEYSWLPGDVKTTEKLSASVGVYFKETLKRFEILGAIAYTLGGLLWAAAIYSCVKETVLS